MRKRIGLMFAAFAFAFTADAFTVKNLSASSRWPWNGILDVDFTIDEAKVSDLFRVEVAVKYANGSKKLIGRTYVSEPICGRGKNRVSWDARADYPNLKLSDMQVAVTVHPINADACDVYMVIDLSSGPESTKYPVRYTFTPPTLVPTNDLVACAKDPCRTTQMWLKRVKGTVFPFHGTTNGNKGEGIFKVQLSPYYIGMFELTQKQWALVMNSWPSQFTNVTYRDARPCSNINYKDIIGHNRWPENRAVSEVSFVGRMRERTGLSTFNLPTESQWECACRAGDKGSYYSAKYRYKATSGSEAGHVFDYNEGPELGTALVGSYNPNAWGFYDFYGNVMEMCLDAYASEDSLVELYAGENPVIDPVGPAVNAKENYHATRGGCYYNGSGYCNNYDRQYSCRNETGNKDSGKGARFAVSPEWKSHVKEQEQ